MKTKPLNINLTPDEKKIADKAVELIIRDYGTVLKKLSME